MAEPGSIFIKNEVLHPNDSITGHRERVAGALAEFRDRFSLDAIIAISGGAEMGSGQPRERLSELLCGLRGTRIAILNGGTDEGVPEMATKLGRENGFPIVGVFPQRGRKYVLAGGLDLAIEAMPPSFGEPVFGTESSTFSSIPDGMAVVGGSFGTSVEVSNILKDNKRKIKKDRQPIYLVPIRGTGGIADIIHMFPDIAKVASSLPDRPVFSGGAAADFLRDRLNLGSTMPRVNGYASNGHPPRLLW